MLRNKHTTQRNMTAIINSVCIRRFKEISGYSRTIPGTLLSAMFWVIIGGEFEMKLVEMFMEIPRSLRCEGMSKI